MEEETSTYSWPSSCNVNHRPTESNYLHFHLRLRRDSNCDLRGGMRVCYHCVTLAPASTFKKDFDQNANFLSQARFQPKYKRGKYTEGF